MQKQIDYNTQNDAENELLIAADNQETFHQGDITFRFHCASVQVQVLSGAPLRKDLWMSGSRAGRARLDSKGLSSFKIVAADAGPRFCF